jgi:hypothetical protein
MFPWRDVHATTIFLTAQVCYMLCNQPKLVYFSFSGRNQRGWRRGPAVRD